MELNPFIIRQVYISVVNIDQTRRMEYKENSLERRHNEVYTWFRNFRIDNLENDQVFIFYHHGYAWLWLMLVQLIRLIPERFLTFCQHAQDWIVGVWVKLRKRYVALLVLNLNEGPSAVARVMHQALEAVSTVHGHERDEINNHRKGSRDWHSRKCFSFIYNNIFFKNWKSIINYFRPHFLKKDHLSSWSPSREKLRPIRRINTLSLPLLRQNYF